jgi:hypothetical protein
MRYLLPILALSFASLGLSQPAQVQVNADCTIAFNLSASGQAAPTAGIDNESFGCNSWQISYANNGFSAISLQVQSAPNTSGVLGTCTAGSWGSIGGTLTFGVNPNTNTTGASSLIQAYGTSFAPCVRVALTSATGTGNVTGVLLGYRAAGTAGTSSAGGIASNINVQNYGGNAVASAGANGVFAVAGNVANGAAPTADPVLVAGFDGTNQDSIRTDTTGGILPSGVAVVFANGLSNIQLIEQGNNAGSPASLVYRTFPFKFNGSTWDRDQNCATAKPVITNLAASGNTLIFTGTAAQNIYICDVEFSTGTPEDFKLQEGTGATCNVGTADATALMKNISAWSLTPGGGSTATLITQTAGDSLCANQTGTQAAGVTVWAIKY